MGSHRLRETHRTQLWKYCTVLTPQDILTLATGRRNGIAPERDILNLAGQVSKIYEREISDRQDIVCHWLGCLTKQPDVSTCNKRSSPEDSESGAPGDRDNEERSDQDTGRRDPSGSRRKTNHPAANTSISRRGNHSSSGNQQRSIIVYEGQPINPNLATLVHYSEKSHSDYASIRSWSDRVSEYGSDISNTKNDILGGEYHDIKESVDQPTLIDGSPNSAKSYNVTLS